MAEQNKNRQYKNNKRRKPYNKNRQEQQQPKKKRDNTMAKKCAFCGSGMKSRGSIGTCGALSWKCRNTKCGRTVKEFKKVVPPVPLVPVSVLDIKYGK